MISVYNDAYEALEDGDVYFAAKKFNEAELLYPQSKWAPKSSLDGLSPILFTHKIFIMMQFSNLKDLLRLIQTTKISLCSLFNCNVLLRKHH